MSLVTMFTNPPRRWRRAQRLTGRIEEIRYQHAADGKWYKHKFEPGAAIDVESDGTATIGRDDGKPVWMDDGYDPNPKHSDKHSLDSGRDEMLFLTNPHSRRATVHTSRRARTTTTAGGPVPRSRHRKKRSLSMATRKRKRTATGRFVKRASAPKRRRRHAVARHHAVNPPKRRRRVVRRHAVNPARRRRHAVTKSRRRRHYARNPRFSVNFLLEGVKDGLAVNVGQVGTRKLSGLASQYVPGLAGTSGAMYTASGYIGAVVTAIVARKALPKFSRMIAAGAFSEANNRLLAQTPVAPYLGAHAPTIRRGNAAVMGWPQVRALPAGAGVKGWPMRKVGGMKVVG